MPLQVYVDEPPGNNPLAHSVYVEASSLDSKRHRWVGYGGFGVAQNLNDETALGTSGAGPCQIIIVHKALGRGALGHYPAHNDPAEIVRGVQQMIAQLGHGPVAAVVFAAGEIGEGITQRAYEITIIGRVRALCPGAQIQWPRGPRAGGAWGAGYYLPLTEEIGLFRDQPGKFGGAGDAASEITLHDYL